jgi:hypothetical protein
MKLMGGAEGGGVVECIAEKQDQVVAGAFFVAQHLVKNSSSLSETAFDLLHMVRVRWE